MTVRLDAADAVELGELLGFISGWLGSDRDHLAGSFARFVGSDGYRIEELRADLERFEFLVVGNGGPLLGGEGGER